MFKFVWRWSFFNPDFFRSFCHQRIYDTTLGFRDMGTWRFCDRRWHARGRVIGYSSSWISLKGGFNMNDMVRQSSSTWFYNIHLSVVFHIQKRVTLPIFLLSRALEDRRWLHNYSGMRQLGLPHIATALPLPENLAWNWKYQHSWIVQKKCVVFVCLVKNWT